MTAGERIIVFLFIFSTVAVMVNASGLWSGSMPTQNLSTTTARIEEITVSENAESGSDFTDSITGGIKFIFTALSFLKALIVGIYDFPDLMASYGVPTYITNGLFALIVLTLAFMLIKWGTGRN